MAVNLGDVTFGITGVTKGFNKIFSDLNKLTSMTDKAARSQTKGAKATATALGKQERALKGAIQQAAGLRAALTKAGAPAALFADVTRATRLYSKEMARGKISTLQFGRAQDLLTARLGKVKRSLGSFTTSKARKQQGRFNEVIRDLESASVLAVGPLSGLGARVRALGAITSRSTLKIAAFLGGIAAAVVGISKLAVGAIRARKSMDIILAGLQAASGSALQAAEDFKFLTLVADKFGQEIESSAIEFSKFAAAARGTSIQGEGVRIVFEGVAAAAAALKIKADDVGGIFKALQQVMSKGTAQAEEIRGQFGERLPGGFKIAADAMGLTTAAFSVMLKKGEVIAEDFLPKLGAELLRRFGVDGVNAANSLQNSISRLSNAFLLFNLKMDAAIGISSIFKGLIESLSATINFMTDNLALLRAALGATLGLMTAIFRTQIIAGFALLAKGILILRDAVLAFNFALLLNPLTAFPTLLLRIAAAAGGAAIAYFAFGSSEKEVSAETTKLIAKFDELAKANENVGIVSKTAAKALSLGFANQIGNLSSQIDKLSEKIPKKLSLLQKGLLGAAGSPVKLDLLSFLGLSKTAENILEVKRLQEILDDISFKFKKLTEFAQDDDSSKISKPFDRAKASILELIGKMDVLSAKQAEIAAGVATPRRFEVIDALVEAQELLEKLTDTQKDKLQKLLLSVGFAGDSAKEALAALIVGISDGSIKIDKFFDSLKKLPKVISEYARKIEDLNKKTDVLGKGPKIVAALNAEFKRRDALAAYAKKLEDASASLAQINVLTAEFGQALEAFDIAEQKANKLNDTVDTLVSGFDRGFDRIGSAITEAFLKGEDAAISFQNIMNAVMSELVQSVLDALVIDPLKEAAGGLLRGFLGNLFGATPTTGSFGAAGSGTLSGIAKGAAFQNGVRKFGKGGITNGPEIFPFKNGIGLRGEAGTEAILPLKRTSGGELGVKAVGGGGGVVINIINKTDAGVATKRSKTASGGEEIDVLIDKSLSRSLRTGGESIRTLEDLFGTSIAPIGR